MEEYATQSPQSDDLMETNFLDTATLLQPISSEKPSGDSMLYSNEFDAIRKAREAEDPNLPQGVWEHELKKADWNQVITSCTEILTKKSKDVLVAGWLCDALFATNGLDGLNDGLTLILQLSQTFWDTIHPRYEEKDFSNRLSPYFWITKTITEDIYTIEITERSHKYDFIFSYADWIEAEHLQHLITKDPDALDYARKAGKPTLKDINIVASYVDNNFYIRLVEQLQHTLTLVEALNTFLDGKCGSEAPSFMTMRERLETIINKTSSWIRQDELPAPPAPEPAEEQPEEHTDAKEHVSADAPQPRTIDSRATAYQLLNEAADYLLTVEPHSPAPYLVKRAVTWGNMSLSELFIELINEGRDLNSTLKLLGIPGQGTQ